jgi:hypothetical protein
MSAQQRRGGSTPAPVHAYDTLLLALLQCVTWFDWHLFQTLAAVAHVTRSCEILRNWKYNERIATLSHGLMLDIQHCQAVTVLRLLLLALNLPQSIVCHVLYVLFWGVLISSDSRLWLLSRSESLGQCVC